MKGVGNPSFVVRRRRKDCIRVTCWLWGLVLSGFVVDRSAHLFELLSTILGLPREIQGG